MSRAIAHCHSRAALTDPFALSLSKGERGKAAIRGFEGTGFDKLSPNGITGVSPTNSAYVGCIA